MCGSPYSLKHRRSSLEAHIKLYYTFLTAIVYVKKDATHHSHPSALIFGHSFSGLITLIGLYGYRLSWHILLLFLLIIYTFLYAST